MPIETKGDKITYKQAKEFTANVTRTEKGKATKKNTDTPKPKDKGKD